MIQELDDVTPHRVTVDPDKRGNYMIEVHFNSRRKFTKTGINLAVINVWKSRS